MNRGVWWATVREVAELDTTEQLTHTSILAWEIPRTEKPGGLQSLGHKRVRHNLVTKQLQFQEGMTFFCSFVIGVQLLCNLVLVSGVQQNTSAPYPRSWTSLPPS